MPTYLNSPFQKTRALQDGVPEYLYGSYASDVALTRLLVSEVALTSNVATLTVQVVEGNIPAVGSTISVQGTATGAGEFNVTRIPLTAVSINASTGAGTVSFDLTGTNVTTTADTGEAIVDTPEVGETIAEGSSIAAAALYHQDIPPGSRAISASVTVTGITAATIKLQGANFNEDSQFTDVATVLTVASSTPYYGQSVSDGVDYLFYRLNVSGLSGTGTIVGKVVME